MCFILGNTKDRLSRSISVVHRGPIMNEIHRILEIPPWGGACPASVPLMKGVDICRNECPLGVLVEGGCWQ